MSSRIIRGYWSCKYCGTTDIDGLIDVCPNCGKQKSADVKYYMKQGIAEEVTDTELQKAKIKICPYCNQLNNYADGVCVACGAEKSEAEFEYGETKMDKSETKTDVFENTLPDETAPKDDENDTLVDREDVYAATRICSRLAVSLQRCSRLLDCYFSCSNQSRSQKRLSDFPGNELSQSKRSEQ